MLSGRPGFLSVPDPRTLHVTAAAAASDPAALGLEDGDAVGLLGIQLETRRRNRVNGSVRRREASGFDVAVEHSFGNCDKYITVRQHSFARDPFARVEIETLKSEALNGRMTRMIREADTLFVASYLDPEDGRRQVDVSHRGGEAGFVRVGGDGTIEIPDFAGNSFFNTLGNILENPKCGLLVVDFEKGDLLHLSGDGEVVFDAPELSRFEGAKRFWRFRTRTAVLQFKALPLRFTS
jgi:predicted pyridoxine 5'-phosphate oxidase superfamily flavin-nucleotide-binding protein